MNLTTQKFIEVLKSIIPVTVIVLILHLTLAPLETPMLIRFMIGVVLIIIGLSLFLIGVDKGITPLGNQVGESIAKTNKLWFVLLAGLILGFIISIAEPSLIVFGQQVEIVTKSQIMSNQLIMTVSLGLGVLLMYGLFRIVYNIPLYITLIVLYLIVFVLALFTSPELLVIAFDASGATTGVLAVPFILALAFGISHLKKDTRASEKDSFGTIAIVSVGAILAVMVLSFFTNDMVFLPSLDIETGDKTAIFDPFFRAMPSVISHSLIAFLPIITLFMLVQFYQKIFNIKLYYRTFKALIYALFGLIIFLLGVNAGFMDVGIELGETLALLEYKIIIISVAFILGLATILAEPAVHVLTQQIENVTSGYVPRKAVLIALSFGAGLAVALSALRIFVPSLQIWHFLLPGYMLAIGLMFITPKMFVGIAFDAGGVATGPMTATFILAFTQGAANAHEGAHVILDGFGMIAMVALIPIITLEVLGLMFKSKSKKEVAKSE